MICQGKIERRSSRRALSHLARKPAYPSNDVDFVPAAFVRLVERIVRDDANPRWIAVGDVLEPFGYETHAIVKHKYAGWRGRAPAQVNQHDVAIVERWHHAVALDMHYAQIGWIGA